MTNFLEIDGSFGEGGGQVLRSALSLSILTKKPFIIKNIRAKRSKPGLKAQHLTSISAARDICGATVTGDRLSSTKLEFTPDSSVSGNYFFDIQTAGATSLVFHTIALPLSLTSETSQVRIKGGTHVPFSPIFEYLGEIWQSMMEKIQGNIKLEIEQAGLYPKGGGLIKAQIEPITETKAIEILERPGIKKITICAISSRLPENIAEREIEALSKFIRKNGISCPVEEKIQTYQAYDSGNCLFLKCEFKNDISVGFSVMGKQGKSSEKVAEELGRDFMKYWKSKAVFDEHLADQVLLPLAFAKNPSSYTVANITQHLTTNAHIVTMFTGAKIEIHGNEGKPGKVEIFPVSL